MIASVMVHPARLFTGGTCAAPASSKSGVGENRKIALRTCKGKGKARPKTEQTQTLLFVIKFR